MFEHYINIQTFLLFPHSIACSQHCEPFQNYTVYSISSIQYFKFMQVYCSIFRVVAQVY